MVGSMARWFTAQTCPVGGGLLSRREGGLESCPQSFHSTAGLCQVFVPSGSVLCSSVLRSPHRTLGIRLRPVMKKSIVSKKKHTADVGFAKCGDSPAHVAAHAPPKPCEQSLEQRIAQSLYRVRVPHFPAKDCEGLLELAGDTITFRDQLKTARQQAVGGNPLRPLQRSQAPRTKSGSRE